MSRIPARKTNGNRRSTGLAGVGLLIAGNLGWAAAQPYRYLAGRSCSSAHAFLIRSRGLDLHFVPLDAGAVELGKDGVSVIGGHVHKQMPLTDVHVANDLARQASLTGARGDDGKR